MLEPRTAMGMSGLPIRARSNVAIDEMSSSTRPSIGPSLAPWPR